jgi:hypothetical protein
MNRFKALTTASLLATALLHPAAQATPVAGQGNWQTTLQNRDLNGDGVTDAFYDTQLNITWLRNANTVGDRAIGLYGLPTGLMNWDTANTWATNLNVSGITGWRLPTTNDTGAPGCDFAYSGTDCGYDVQTSTGNAVNNELAHLYYVTLGNLACVNAAGTSGVAGCGLTNTANFQNFEQYAYWSGTEYAPITRAAWDFGTNKDDGNAGNQYFNRKVNELYAVAVRSGDVGAVPVPTTAALVLLALGAMAVARRKQPS